MVEFFEIWMLGWEGGGGIVMLCFWVLVESVMFGVVVLDCEYGEFGNLRFLRIGLLELCVLVLSMRDYM